MARNILEEHFTDFDELILNELNDETQQYENLNAVC